jgi:hypothetical protein
MPRTVKGHAKKKTAGHNKTMAMQVTNADGDLCGVGIFGLNVLLIDEKDYWVAQGLQIDYAVQGETIEAAKKNFETGLFESIDLNVKTFGHIGGLLSCAAPEVFAEAANARNKGKMQTYTSVTIHDISPESQEYLLYDHIRFLKAEKDQLAA